MKDFCEIFNIASNLLNLRIGQLTKADFLAELVNLSVDLDLSVYEEARFTIYAMIGLKPLSDEEEREAILSILDNNRNIEVRLYQAYSV